MKRLEEIHSEVTSSLERHRFKEALRSVMTAAQLGNQMLQSATPWKYLKDLDGEGARNHCLNSHLDGDYRDILLLTQPFLPFSAQRLWEALGESGDVSQADWDSAIDWGVEYKWNDAEANHYSKD